MLVRNQLRSNKYEICGGGGDSLEVTVAGVQNGFREYH